MHTQNPTQIQWSPKQRWPAPTPLVLIHDGGGTTFGYHLLGSLGRDVYAIHNPHFWSGQTWSGGMDEMAAHYVQLIKQAGIHGRIILGGWSLGGYLSIAIARLLAAESVRDIVIWRLVIIDSPFHIPFSNYVGATPKADLPILPALVQKCLDNCEALLDTWELPDWDDSSRTLHDVDSSTVLDREVQGAQLQIAPGTFLHKTLQGELISLSTQDSLKDSNNANGNERKSAQQGCDLELQRETMPRAKVSLPPAVLLRCGLRSSSRDSHSCTPRIDYFRDDARLGWRCNYPDYIKMVIDVDANHYNIFALERVKAVTSQINDALVFLDTF